MAIVFQEVTAEMPDASPRPLQPQDSSSSASDNQMTLERLRAAMLRDAQRQARLWAD